MIVWLMDTKRAGRAISLALEVFLYHAKALQETTDAQPMRATQIPHA
jgi:hypothetical protein